MVHESSPSITESDFGRHPRRIVRDIRLDDPAKGPQNLSLRVEVHSEEEMFPCGSGFSEFLSATLLAAAGAAFSLSIAAQQVPQQLHPPAGQRVLFQVHAQGDQIYTCKADGTQFTWTLKAPEAKLFGNDGKPFGKHFARPSWEANDGSRVTGKAVASASPDPASIPWLLLDTTSHDGSGVLSPVTHIRRLNTKGGKAPASGCDAPHVGQDIQVRYTAEYLFYGSK
jgi:hypothetical protein